MFFGKPLIDQNETIRFTEQSFDSVPPSSTEKEEGAGQRIHFKLLFNHGTQDHPHIRIAALSEYSDDF